MTGPRPRRSRTCGRALAQGSAADGCPWQRCVVHAARTLGATPALVVAVSARPGAIPGRRAELHGSRARVEDRSRRRLGARDHPSPLSSTSRAMRSHANSRAHAPAEHACICVVCASDPGNRGLRLRPVPAALCGLGTGAAQSSGVSALRTCHPHCHRLPRANGCRPYQYCNPVDPKKSTGPWACLNTLSHSSGGGGPKRPPAPKRFAGGPERVRLY